MAKMEVRMPEEFLLKLSRLGNKTDEVCEKALEAGGKVVLAKAKTNLAATVGKGTKHKRRSTGELVRSLGLTPVKKDRGGASNIKVGFSEPRADGGSNAKLANIIEYGKHGQPARPFLKPAKSQSRKGMVAAMEQALDEEVRRI
jgi:HK97 gp10 family phage protein